ncbi:MAG: hypothetical protein A2033_05210 [Bacteroidetes bacterium GWA2_31_9]|nr:MAG: hypothetical protein A2033_05210 [Bacteroidetes bacterium GWA2_31_9]
MFFKYLITFLFSTVKFAFSFPLAIYQYKFNYIETLITTTLGGFVGVLLFVFLTDYIVLIWNYLASITKINTIPLVVNNSNQPKKIITRRNKMIVKIKNKYGLIGLAILTPVLLSIPVGTFLCIRYYPNYKKTILLLFLSIVLWSNIISFIVYKL